MTERAADFDAQLIKHQRLLHMFARRYEKNRDRQEELVNDTVVRALERSSQFRGEGSFTGWLRCLMWQVVTRQREAAGMKKRKATFVSYGEQALGRASVQPTQEANADLATALKKVEGTRALSRLGKGMLQSEIAQELGIGNSRITQIVKDERAAVFGMAA